MILRIAFVAVALVVAMLLLRRPAPQPAIQTLPAPSGGSLSAEPSPHHERRHALADDELVVYVVGAVKRPGLYRLRTGDRDSRAVALAGGLTAAADAAGVNLAQRAADGEEIDVPASGAVSASHPRPHRAGTRRRHAAVSPPPASVDVNAADERQLAAVPGIGRAIAARIVMLRSREGNFASLDELLDVAGMTQGRLERARPYLREL